MFNHSSYGVQGFEVIYRNLLKMFLSQSKLGLTTQMALPMSAEYFVWKVLIPETALGLISEDFSLAISDPFVYKTLLDNQEFGMVMFPDQDSTD